MNSDENSTEIITMASPEDRVADESDSEDDDEDLNVSTLPCCQTKLMLSSQLNIDILN